MIGERDSRRLHLQDLSQPLRVHSCPPLLRRIRTSSEHLRALEDGLKLSKGYCWQEKAVNPRGDCRQRKENRFQGEVLEWKYAAARRHCPAASRRRAGVQRAISGSAFIRRG